MPVILTNADGQHLSLFQDRFLGKNGVYVLTPEVMSHVMDQLRLVAQGKIYSARLNFRKGKNAFVEIYFCHNHSDSTVAISLYNTDTTEYDGYVFDASQLVIKHNLWHDTYTPRSY